MTPATRCYCPRPATFSDGGHAWDRAAACPLFPFAPRFFYAVVAGDGEVLSTAPGHAPNAALVGLSQAEREEAEETSFPREMYLERSHHTFGGEVFSKRRVDERELTEAARA